MPTSPFPNSAVSSPPPPFDAELAVVVVPLSLPQAARNAAAAVDPPVSARNLRRENGALASLAIDFLGISAPPSFAASAFPYGSTEASGSATPEPTPAVNVL